jgi:transketolase
MSTSEYTGLNHRQMADWQYKGGHPGTVMGAATIGIALWRYHMQYNPKNADWLNRDRKPISNASLQS